MQEKRRSARWTLEGRQAQFRLLEAEDYRQCRVEDISFGGCHIICRDVLPVESEVEIEISLPYLDPIVAEAKVVWRKEEVFNKHQGMKFSKIGDFDKEKIFLYVRDNFREQLVQKWWAGVK